MVGRLGACVNKSQLGRRREGVEMRMKLVVIMVAILALAAAMDASAANAPQKHLVQLARTNRHLRAVLQSTREELASVRKQLTATKAEVRAAKKHTAELAETLSRVETQLSNVRAKLATISIPLTVAVNDVRHEAAWAGSTPQSLALAAMDYVIGHVRTGMYGYLETVYHESPGGPDLPSYYANVNTILRTQTGICVHAERVFGAIMEALGLPVRGVGFTYAEPVGTPDAHTAAEIYYNGGWHFFDPTFGVVYEDRYGNILDIADARAAGAQSVTRVKDNAAFVNLIENADSPRSDDTWFELAPSTGVGYAMQP
jgi:hypothetical protein